MSTVHSTSHFELYILGILHKIVIFMQCYALLQCVISVIIYRCLYTWNPCKLARSATKDYGSETSTLGLMSMYHFIL